MPFYPPTKPHKNADAYEHGYYDGYADAMWDASLGEPGKRPDDMTFNGLELSPGSAYLIEFVHEVGPHGAALAAGTSDQWVEGCGACEAERRGWIVPWDKEDHDTREGR